MTARSGAYQDYIQLDKVAVGRASGVLTEISMSSMLALSQFAGCCGYRETGTSSSLDYNL
jgi:hypothetical protein